MSRSVEREIVPKVQREEAKRDFEEYLFYEKRFENIESLDLTIYGGIGQAASAFMQEKLFHIYYGYIQAEKRYYRSMLISEDSGLKSDKKAIDLITKDIKKYDSMQVFLKLLKIQIPSTADMIVFATDAKLKEENKEEYEKQLKEGQLNVKKNFTECPRCEVKILLSSDFYSKLLALARVKNIPLYPTTDSYTRGTYAKWIQWIVFGDDYEGVKEEKNIWNRFEVWVINHYFKLDVAASIGTAFQKEINLLKVEQHKKILENRVFVLRTLASFDDVPFQRIRVCCIQESLNMLICMINESGDSDDLNEVFLEWKNNVIQLQESIWNAFMEYKEDLQNEKEENSLTMYAGEKFYYMIMTCVTMGIDEIYEYIVSDVKKHTHTDIVSFIADRIRIMKSLAQDNGAEDMGAALEKIVNEMRRKILKTNQFKGTGKINKKHIRDFCNAAQKGCKDYIIHNIAYIISRDFDGLFGNQEDNYVLLKKYVKEAYNIDCKSAAPLTDDNIIVLNSLYSKHIAVFPYPLMAADNHKIEESP